MSQILYILVGVLATALVGVIAWALTDRLQWERYKNMIEVNTGRLDKIETRLETVPPHCVAKEQHDDLQKLITDYHAEDLKAIEHLTERIDRILNGALHAT